MKHLAIISVFATLLFGCAPTADTPICTLDHGHLAVQLSGVTVSSYSGRPYLSVEKVGHTCVAYRADGTDVFDISNPSLLTLISTTEATPTPEAPQ
jgi:hypothetical protein